MRMLLAVMLWLPMTSAFAADQPTINDAMVSRLSTRMTQVFRHSGIQGVGVDVLKCYDTAIGDDIATQECVVYDASAKLFDHQMTHLFITRGGSLPADVFDDPSFNSRSDTYGFYAFMRDPIEKLLVQPTAEKIVNRVLQSLNRHPPGG